MANNGRRRVVVTGMGAVTPLGNDVETSWRAAVEGRSGIGPITRFDTTAYDSRIAGEVRDFNAEDYVPAKDLRRMDRFIHYAIATAKQAAAQANLVINQDNAEQVGVLCKAPAAFWPPSSSTSPPDNVCSAMSGEALE